MLCTYQGGHRVRLLGHGEKRCSNIVPGFLKIISSGKLNNTKFEAIAFGLKVTPGLLVRLQSQRSRAPSIRLKKKQEVTATR